MSETSDDEIFVFPAANPTAQKNLVKSIENPIQPESTVFDGFEEISETLHNELERIKNTAGGLYAWGAEPRGHADSTWRKMSRGDYVLAYYFKGYHYVARVLASFHEPTLATNIWGTNEDTGNTWEYMYFLTKPMKIDVPASWIADFLNSKESSWVYQGFSRIGGANREAILNTCGSVQDFVKLLLGYKGDGTPPELLIASDKNEEVAKTSLETDHIVYGEQLEKLIPDLEGRKRIRQHVTYERSARNRALAIELRGRTCEVCGFNFDEVYGSEQDGYEFVFPGGEKWTGGLARFVAEERECCRFFAFELLFEPGLGPVSLRMRGPAGTKEFLAGQFAEEFPREHFLKRG